MQHLAGECGPRVFQTGLPLPTLPDPACSLDVGLGPGLCGVRSSLVLGLVQKLDLVLTSVVLERICPLGACGQGIICPSPR